MKFDFWHFVLAAILIIVGVIVALKIIFWVANVLFAIIVVAAVIAAVCGLFYVGYLVLRKAV